MLTIFDRYIIAKRKKIWDHFGWNYKGIGYLNKHGGLNDGCTLCKTETFYKKFSNKQQRLKLKNDLKNWNSN